MAHSEAAPGVATAARDDLQPLLTSKVHSLDHVLIVLDPHNHIRPAVGLEPVPDHFIAYGSEIRSVCRDDLSFDSPAQFAPFFHGNSGFALIRAGFRGEHGRVFPAKTGPGSRRRNETPARHSALAVLADIR
jgi:hypothetical protein